MLVSKEYYVLNFIFVCFAFFLFTLLISTFGYFFYYCLSKVEKKEIKLNIFEKFLISFTIGLTIYISIGFLLDTFYLFNFYTGYLTIIIFNIIYIFFFIRFGIINKKTTLDFYNLIKQNFSKNYKHYLIFIFILVLVFFLQIWIQWTIITKKYAISSKDTYVWLGQSWYLLEKGNLWREHLIIQYPKGYIFYLAGPELIFPDYRFAYFYMKFASIPFFSFYIFTMAIILKKVFVKNYFIFLGLLFVLVSNFLFSRFIPFVSSAICALLILISLIIFYAKCPFYLNAFILVSMLLINALFGIFYLIGLIILLAIKLIYLEVPIKDYFKEDILKPVIIIIILIIPYILHVFFVQELRIIDFIDYFNELLNISNNHIPLSYYNISTHKLLQIKYILRDLFPNNDIMSIFLDIQKRILALFLIFSIIGLILPNKYLNKKYNDLLNFGKISILIIIIFYILEIYSLNSSNEFLRNSEWFKLRAVEGFAGPCIIIACFPIEKIITKSKLLTGYLLNYHYKYRNLIKNNFFFKLLKIENFLIAIILISLIANIHLNLVNRSIYYTYYFEQDQMDTIFYIKEHIPDDSNILVSDFNDGPNCLYELLSTYDVYKWDFEFSENSFNETINYIIDKKIQYILLDHTMINSTEKGSFTHYPYFEKMYENDYNIVFDVEI